MEWSLALINSGAANRRLLTTHRFPYTRAPEALHLLHDHPNQPLGLLLHWDTDETQRPPTPRSSAATVRLSMP